MKKIGEKIGDNWFGNAVQAVGKWWENPIRIIDRAIGKRRRKRKIPVPVPNLSGTDTDTKACNFGSSKLQQTATTTILQVINLTMFIY